MSSHVPTKNALLIASACLLGLLSTTGASLPYPILAPLFGNDTGSPLTSFLGLPPKLLLGIALMVNPLGLLIGSAVLGAVSDRFGRRRILLTTAIGGAVGHALTAAALVTESFRCSCWHASPPACSRGTGRSCAPCWRKG
jgi:DHA1 family tetracycline resistance protein-like MFS transporter